MATEQLTDPSADERSRIFTHVRGRLATEFPHASETAVAEAVHRAWTSLADARVRDFLEILVEREAAAHLRAFALAPLF